MLDIFLGDRRSNRSATAQRLKYSKQACVRRGFGSISSKFGPGGTLANRAPNSIISSRRAVKHQAEITLGRTRLVSLRLDSCRAKLPEARAWSCFGSTSAAVIRAKRTTSEKPLLTHYLGTASRLGPIRSTECRGYMSPAGRKLGPLPNPWCVWSKCGEPAIRGLGARWPSRFSAERFSDRIEGQAYAGGCTEPRNF